jgi:hypothetical protein
VLISAGAIRIKGISMTAFFGRVLFLALALAALPLATAQAKSVTLTYLGYLAGFPVLQMTAQADLPVGADGAVGDGVYGLNANIVTQGSLATLYPYRMTVSANGRLADGRALPTQFHSEGQIMSKTESVTLTYAKNGTVDIKAVPLTRQAQDAAAKGTANGTIDPGSLVLAVIANFAQKGTCTASYKLFDGVRRYDLNVTEVGDGNIQMYKRSHYQGPATACQAVPQLIQGFAQMAVESKLYPESAKIWIANAVPGMPAVPVRIYTQNALGEMVFDLIEVQ